MYSRQRGATMMTMVNVLFLVVLVILAVKIGPAYLDDRTVNAIITEAVATPDIVAEGSRGLQTSIGKRLDINDIDLPKDALAYSRDGNIWYVDVNYERRIPIVSNLSVVLTFSHHYEAVNP